MEVKSEVNVFPEAQVTLTIVRTFEGESQVIPVKLVLRWSESEKALFSIKKADCNGYTLCVIRSSNGFNRLLCRKKRGSGRPVDKEVAFRDHEETF